MVLTCSTRPGALGPVVSDWFMDAVAPLARELDVQLTPVSLRELDLPFLDEDEHPTSGHYVHEHSRKWSAMVAAADGFIVVTPEYNYGMPASLKNALDFLAVEWAWKGMGFISYCNTSAGTRSVQHAKQVISTLRLVPLGATVALRIGEKLIEKTGSKASHVLESPQLTRAAQGVLSELVRVCAALKPLREARSPGSIKGPVSGSYARELTSQDAAQVMVLQRCCWVDEAIANETQDVPAFTESLNDIQDWLGEWNTWGLWLDGRLLGMVRTIEERVTPGEKLAHIGRLAVTPELRGKGIGSWLLNLAQENLSPSVEAVELATGSKSFANIALYESHGFTQVSDKNDSVYLRKTRPAGVVS